MGTIAAGASKQYAINVAIDPASRRWPARRRRTAAYGRFGRDSFPWEETNRVDELRSALGLQTRGSGGRW